LHYGCTSKINYTLTRNFELGYYVNISTNLAEAILGLAGPDSSPLGRAGF